MGFVLSPGLAAKCEAMADPQTAKRGRASVQPTPCLPWSVSFTLPTWVVSRANQRSHWSAVARRNVSEGHAVTAALLSAGLFTATPRKPLRVRMVRLYKGRPMDGDNLATAFKSVRDALAAWLGVDDGDESAQWFYGQEKARHAACRIEIAGGVDR